VYTYIVDLFNDDNQGLHVSVSNGKYNLQVFADSMTDAKQKVINRAKNDSFYDQDWKASIQKCLPGGRRDIGLTVTDIFSQERRSIINLF